MKHSVYADLVSFVSVLDACIDKATTRLLYSPYIKHSFAHHCIHKPVYKALMCIQIHEP